MSEELRDASRRESEDVPWGRDEKAVSKRVQGCFLPRVWGSPDLILPQEWGARGLKESFETGASGLHAAVSQS